MDWLLFIVALASIQVSTEHAATERECVERAERMNAEHHDVLHAFCRDRNTFHGEPVTYTDYGKPITYPSD